MPSMARGLTSVGGTTVVKPAARAWSIAMFDQRELEVGAGTGEVVEPRAGDLRAAVEVDGAEDPAELDVVPRLEVELTRRPDVLEHHVVVLAPGRRLVGSGVGDRVDGVAPVLLGLGLRGLRGLHVGGQRLGAGQQLGLLVALGPGDLLAQLLLLRAQVLEVGDRGTPGGVRLEGAVDDLGGQPTLLLGRTDQVGVVAEHAWVDHRTRISTRLGGP